jgi:hypothetical protein
MFLNPMNKASEYQALHDELRASRGVRLYSDLLSRQITFYTFQRNHDELEQLISLHYQLETKGKLGDFTNQKPLHDHLFEVTRRLQNFVFAAKTLVEHTRNYMKLWHHDRPDIMVAYRTKVTQHFVEKGIGPFTKGLRDYFAHCSTPFISSLDEHHAHVRFTLQLETETMAKTPHFHGWLDPALRYIAFHRDTYARKDGGVNLVFYVNHYYEAVIRFYSWLDDQNQEWCRGAWDETVAIQNLIEEFWAERRKNSKLQGEKT